jgi:hypothetical protein
MFWTAELALWHLADSCLLLVDRQLELAHESAQVQRYDFPLAHRRSLILFASAAHVILLLCVRRSAPEGVEAPSRPGHSAAGRP